MAIKVKLEALECLYRKTGLIFSSPEHRVLSGVLLSHTVRPSDNFFVNTPASTNINQSATNLVKVYTTIRSRMSSIMDLIGPELLVICP